MKKKYYSLDVGAEPFECRLRLSFDYTRYGKLILGHFSMDGSTGDTVWSLLQDPLCHLDMFCLEGLEPMKVAYWTSKYFSDSMMHDILECLWGWSYYVDAEPIYNWFPVGTSNPLGFHTKAMATLFFRKVIFDSLHIAFSPGSRLTRNTRIKKIFTPTLNYNLRRELRSYYK